MYLPIDFPGKLATISHMKNPTTTVESDTKPTTEAVDPMSFSFRLEQSVLQLTRETEAGLEDWSPLIEKMQAVLVELKRVGLENR